MELYLSDNNKIRDYTFRLYIFILIITGLSITFLPIDINIICIISIILLSSTCIIGIICVMINHFYRNLDLEQGLSTIQ